MPDLATATSNGAPAFDPMVELGSSGLRRWSGYVAEEFLTQLQGRRGMEAYREMAENDAVAGAVLFVIEMLCRTAQWDIEPGGPDLEDLDRAEFVRGCLSDMSATWEDTLSEILSMLTYGWAYHEQVFKRRLGDSQDPAQRSKHHDGLIGWRKLSLRGQDSLLKWEFDADGGIQGLVQSPPPDYRYRHVPIQKALLFRPKAHKNNPEGASVLRNAWTSYYFKKHIQRIEAIGIERDLAGLPVAKVPAEMLATGASTAAQATIAKIKKIVTQIRRDEQEGIIWPRAYDDRGNEKYSLELLSTGGQRQFDTDKIVRRYDAAIAQTVLADLILIGHSGTGSYALVREKVDLFSTALDAWLDSIAETFNRYAIPPLFRLNGFATDNLPRLAHKRVIKVSLPDVAQLLTALTGAGATLFPDDALLGHVLRMADLPVPVAGLVEVGKSWDGPGSRDLAETLRGFRHQADRLAKAERTDLAGAGLPDDARAAFLAAIRQECQAAVQDALRAQSRAAV